MHYYYFFWFCLFAHVCTFPTPPHRCGDVSDNTQYTDGLYKGTMSSGEFIIGRETGSPSRSFFCTVNCITNMRPFSIHAPTPTPPHCHNRLDLQMFLIAAETKIVELVSCFFFCGATLNFSIMNSLFFSTILRTGRFHLRLRSPPQSRLEQTTR